MGIAPSLYGALFLTGLLGSLGHCLGMCAPLVLMVSAGARANGLNLPGAQLVYHVFRITIYAILGAIAGALGATLQMGGHLTGLAGAISLLLGLGVIFFGLSYLGWLPLGRLQGSGRWVGRIMSQALRRGGMGGVMLLGALNGLLPCGLVYGALLVAASLGGPLQGMVGMLFFGLATIPALFLVAMGSGMLNVDLRQSMSRVAGFLIVLVGVQLILRGFSGLQVIAHFHVGKLMIW